VVNGARFIGETLASITAQSDVNWVHYVMDGGSTDETQEIVRASMVNEPRRRLIEEKDRGMYDAVFKGFDRARADGFGASESICLWLNSDDLLMPWALATLRQAFAASNADWITTMPCIWDAQTRLQLLLPYAWYPRALIRAGLFQKNGLGWIQQESTFFKRRLLDMLPGKIPEEIRGTRLAGDFLLWRAFADLAAPYPLPLAVSGFRSHGANASATQMDRYEQELKAAGVRILSPSVGRILRLLFRPLAMLKTTLDVRRLSLRNARM
jgi:glycosyltransferase involved in cell wall biosynthesis